MDLWQKLNFFANDSAKYYFTRKHVAQRNQKLLSFAKSFLKMFYFIFPTCSFTYFPRAFQLRLVKLWSWKSKEVWVLLCQSYVEKNPRGGEVGRVCSENENKIYHFFAFRSLAKNVKISVFSRNFVSICFAKKCENFAKWKMGKFCKKCEKIMRKFCKKLTKIVQKIRKFREQIWNSKFAGS